MAAASQILKELGFIVADCDVIAPDEDRGPLALVVRNHDYASVPLNPGWCTALGPGGLGEWAIGGTN